MVDQEKVEAAIKLLLEGIGEDPTREGLLETPARVARMYGEIAGGMDQSAEEHLSKTFAVASNDLVIERDITFYSLCEHHLLPFYGTAAIGYIPNGRVAGLSKLARTVEVYARRLQLQEQLCAQVADALMDYLAPQGAIVLMEAEHMCMTMRGVQKPGTKTVTLARRGVFETIPRSRSGSLGCGPLAGGSSTTLHRRPMRGRRVCGFMASGLAPFGAMPRLDYICANGLFRRHLGNIAQLESGRIFCRHGIDHLLDVARIMWIKNLEEQLEFDREVIYATALLHDIGKDEQYESGISHDVASERVADAILGGMPDDVAFEPADAAAIKTAILGHRKLRVNSQPLERLLYAADKASRACFACPARNACNWSDDKKNLSIRV